MLLDRQLPTPVTTTWSPTQTLRSNPVLVASVCNGIGLPWVLIGLMTLVHRTTPGTLQARVNAALSTVVFAAITLAAAIGAAVLSRRNIHPTGGA